jgi:hypothetical protein
MPIRFVCPHCRQKLSVSTRRAGQRADCPRCKASLEIPTLPEPVAATTSRLVAVEVGESAAHEPAAIAPAMPERTTAPPELPIGEFPEVNSHVDVELIYDAPEFSHGESAASSHQPDLIAVPRWVLYLQGGLLAVVALASFAIGVLAGSTFSGGSAEPRQPQACLIEGTIQYAAGNRQLADEGAVVAVIPQSRGRPDEKAPAIGLRPEDTTPGESSRGVAILRELGGGYARTDQRGRFQVRVPDRGKYLLLVISNARQLKSLDEISTQDLLALGAYFDNAADLVGRQRYQLTQEVVRGDRRVNVLFD